MPVLEFCGISYYLFSSNMLQLVVNSFTSNTQLEHYVLCTGRSEVLLAQKTSSFVFPWFLFAFLLFPYLPYNIAVALCFPPQMPWWLFLIIRAWNYHFQLSISGHTCTKYLSCVRHGAGQVQRGCQDKWGHPCVHMLQSPPGSTCLAFSSSSSSFFGKDSFSPLPFFLLLSFFHVPLPWEWI